MKNINTNEKKKNLTPGYALIQAFFWMNFAAIMGYTSVYLLNCGFSNTQIGVLMAVAGVLSAVLQPIVASYADRPDSQSVKKIIIEIGIIMLVIAALLLLFRNRMVVSGLLYGGSIMLLQLLMPLINSLGMESLNQGKKLNFGMARGMGSVAYAIAAYLLGIIVAGWGEITIPMAMLLILCGLLFTLFLFPFEKSKTSNEKTEKKSGGPLYFFMKYKRFSFVLFGCIFLYISHVLLNSFTYQIVESKGGGSSEMGFAMALAAMLELPTLFLFGYMIKKIRADVWFRISGIFFMVKTLGTLLAPNILSFYFVQIFQMFGWALITVSSVYYVNSVMEEQDAIKGQAYMTMTYTLGSVLGALIGGALIDAVGVNTMLSFATVSAAVGMVIILATARAEKSK